MKAKGIKQAVILTSVLLTGSALLFLQLTRGGRLTATGLPEVPTDGAAAVKVVGEYPAVELVEQRDDHKPGADGAGCLDYYERR